MKMIYFRTKSFLILAGLNVFFFLFSSPVLAAGEFETSYEIIYKLQENGGVRTSQEISLTNKLPDVYASEYSFEIGGVEIDKVSAQDGEGEIIPTVEKKGETTKIGLKFNQRVVGQDKRLTFSVNYDLLGAMVKNGQVWEVNLPRMPDLERLSSGRLILAVPDSFGSAAFISPSLYTETKNDSWRYYLFKKEEAGSLNISAVFGQFQFFDFSLKYHLYNPHSYEGRILVAFPPDTFYQRVYYEKIEPRPETIEIDDDGNWLGVYYLKGSEKKDVLALGSVKIFSEPWDFFGHGSQNPLEAHLLPQPYWEVDDPEIMVKAEKLKTPRAIYEFVVNRLSYDYNKVEKESKREGASLALFRPEESICMEFTDLFVALSRAAGIPARELNGYAYTTNSRLKPLSLVSDILHSWPEYWDEERGIWVQVDPTWGKTTQGRDYFSKFDLNHFVFVIHGIESEFPLPAGAYKLGAEADKDIKVGFGEYQPIASKDLEVNFSFIDKSSWGKQHPEVVIANPGPTAVYNLKLRFEAEKIKIETDSVKEKTIEVIPPFGKIEIPIEIEMPRFFEFGPASLSVFIDKQKYTHPFKIESLVWPQLLFTLVGVCLGILWALFLINLSKWLVRKFIKNGLAKKVSSGAGKTRRLPF